MTNMIPIPDIGPMVPGVLVAIVLSHVAGLLLIQRCRLPLGVEMPHMVDGTETDPALRVGLFTMLGGVAYATIMQMVAMLPMPDMLAGPVLGAMATFGLVLVAISTPYMWKPFMKGRRLPRALIIAGIAHVVLAILIGIGKMTTPVWVQPFWQ